MTLLVLVAMWLWLVPRWLESAVLAQLEQSGFSDVQIGSLQLGFDSLVLHNLRLGTVEPDTGHVTVASVTAQFGLSDLLAMRIDTLVLQAPTWTMAPASGSAASPFDAVMRRFDAGGPTLPLQPLPDLPVRHIAVRGGRIHAPDAAPAVTIDATLTAQAGQWQIDMDAARGPQKVHAVAHLQAEPNAEPPRAAGTVELRLLGAKPLQVEGPCTLAMTTDGRVLAFALDGRPEPFEVEVADLVCTGGGDLQLQAQVPFSQLAAATFAVGVKDFDLAAASGAQVSGLSTETNWTGLPMPTSNGSQQASWRSAQVAEFVGGSGEATFELQAGPELRLQLLQRTVDGIGSVDVEDLRLRPDMRSSPATVSFDQVPLQAWLEALSRGRVTGEGRLSGNLQLIVQTQPQLAIELQGGSLAAAPGGIVRFLDHADTEGQIRQHVEQIVGSQGHDDLVQERLVQALKEFAYTVLEFDIDAAGDGVTLRVHAVGEGQKVPQQLDLNVNLHGFDAAVDTAIAIKLGLDRAKHRVADKIDTEPKGMQMPRKP